jgi:hypothetical protein
LRKTALLLVAAFCLSYSCGKEDIGFEELLTLIDGELHIGALIQAESNILKSISTATGRSEWLALTKRAYMLGAAMESFETLFRVSKAALAKISGAEEIAAVHVYAALRTGRYELAFQSAEEYLESSQWDAIRNEARLRRYAMETGAPTTGDEENPLLRAVFSKDPVALARAADLFDESRLALAAALRFAAEGDVETAADTLAPHALEYAKTALLLFYDARRVDEAARILEETPEAAADLIAGDIYLKLKQTDRAFDFYNDLIDKAPVE